MRTIAEKFRDEGREQGREQGRQEGREEGRQQELVIVLRTLLIQRFGAITPALDTRIAKASRADLEHALERILTAPSAADIFD